MEFAWKGLQEDLTRVDANFGARDEKAGKFKSHAVARSLSTSTSFIESLTKSGLKRDTESPSTR
jgi:hypothetical protein